MCAGLVWPIALPILLLIGFVVGLSRFCSGAKNRRLAKAQLKEKQKRLRVAEAKKCEVEIEQYEKLEREMAKR